MSYTHPTIKEVLTNSIDNYGMSKYFNHKSLLNLACSAFYRKSGFRPTLNNAQQIFDEFVIQWKHYYITKPALEKAYKELAKPIWKFGCSIHISIEDSTREFVRSINPTFKNVFNYRYDGWIIRNNKFEEYMQFCLNNKKQYPYYRKTYTDYSSLAYNGVAEDF